MVLYSGETPVGTANTRFALKSSTYSVSLSHPPMPEPHCMLGIQPESSVAISSIVENADQIAAWTRSLAAFEMPPPGAIAAGSLYTATEFEVSGWDSLRPSLVEMGRAVVRTEHRNGAVVLLMWAGILAYLDHSGYEYVTGCVSVPTHDPAGVTPAGTQVRGVRDFVARRHGAPDEYTVYPYRPVCLDGRGLDDIDPPARPEIPPLMRGYLRLGAQVCGEPAHDPDFGVADFPALLDKHRADTRYLTRLRSVSAATELVS